MQRKLGWMRVVFLLGSGASVHAGIPSVGQITARVLSGWLSSRSTTTSPPVLREFEFDDSQLP
jgi:hypothetical protein